MRDWEKREYEAGKIATIIIIVAIALMFLVLKIGRF